MEIHVAEKDIYSQYEEYLEEHIENVSRAYYWIKGFLPELLLDVDEDTMEDNISYYDASKYSIAEFDAYAEYFYGDRTPEVQAKFDWAWLHHIHNNPHHWQYWLLREDDGDTKALPMPYEYIIEMVCDWWAFSWKSDNLNEIFYWYEDNKAKQVLNEDTRNTVEFILDKLKMAIGGNAIE